MTSKYSVELFTEACNAAGPLHLSVGETDRAAPLRRVFHQPFVVIGRHPTTDLLLDHWRVSRRHAYLQVVKGRLFCIDLGSRTGTEWDDGTKESDWLDPDRSIFIGPYEIGRWSDGEESGQGAGRPAFPGGAFDGDDKTSSYAIEFVNQGRRQPPIHLGEGLALVGSSSECRVRLPYSDVSKAHCSLLRSAQGVWVVDLLGRGGTFVNEIHVRFARLDDGDELRIGRHILRFQINSATRSVTRPVSPNRAIARRQAEVPPARLDRSAGVPSAPPSSSLPMMPTWHYPEHQVHQALDSRSTSQAEFIQTLMQPMVQQFGLMQQQMFEQFHQAMMGMFQTFGAAYREQMIDLREELDEVRRITHELQTLQAEASIRSEVQSAPAAKTQILPPGPPSDGRTNESIAPLPTTIEPVAPTLAFNPERSTARVVDAPPSPRQPTRTNAGVHQVLTDRIAALQTDRQSRWQKILAKLNKTPQ